MIVALIGFGLIVILGVFVVMVIFGAATGNVVGVEVNKLRKAKVRQMLVVPAATKAIQPKPEQYYIKLGNGKVPIEKSEVADAKRKGYEVLLE